MHWSHPDVQGDFPLPFRVLSVTLHDRDNRRWERPLNAQRRVDGSRSVACRLIDRILVRMRWRGVRGPRRGVNT
jgi:hypothetical protein